MSRFRRHHRSVGVPYGYEWSADDPATPERLARITGTENLAPWDGEGLFHGTSADLYETIRQEGLRAAPEWGHGRQGIFVWEDIESALNWANHWYGDGGMVVMVDPAAVRELYEDLDAGNEQFASTLYPTAPHVLRRMGATPEQIKKARRFRPALLIMHDVGPEHLHFYVGDHYDYELENWRGIAEDNQGMGIFAPTLQFTPYNPEPGWARPTVGALPGALDPTWSPPPTEHIQLPGDPKRHPGPHLPTRKSRLHAFWLPKGARGNTRLTYAIDTGETRFEDSVVFAGLPSPDDERVLRSKMGFGEFFEPADFQLPSLLDEAVDEGWEHYSAADAGHDAGFDLELAEHLPHQLVSLTVTKDPANDREARIWRDFMNENVRPQRAHPDQPPPHLRNVGASVATTGVPNVPDSPAEMRKQLKAMGAPGRNILIREITRQLLPIAEPAADAVATDMYDRPSGVEDFMRALRLECGPRGDDIDPLSCLSRAFDTLSLEMQDNLEDLFLWGAFYGGDGYMLDVLDGIDVDEGRALLISLIALGWIGTARTFFDPAEDQALWITEGVKTIARIAATANLGIGSLATFAYWPEIQRASSRTGNAFVYVPFAGNVSIHDDNVYEMSKLWDHPPAEREIWDELLTKVPVSRWKRADTSGHRALTTGASMQDLPAPEISVENFNTRYTVPECPGVVWDTRNGVGAVPNNQDIRYLGFVGVMPPEVFQQLTLPMVDVRHGTLGYLPETRLEPGWGPPMLLVEMANGRPRVVGHEGRHRVRMLRELCPDALLPVAVIIVGGTRARDITPDMLIKLDTGMQSESQRGINRPEWIRGPFFDRVYIRNEVLELTPSRYRPWLRNVGATTGADPSWSPPPSDQIRLRGAARKKDFDAPQLPQRGWRLGPGWLPSHGRNTRLDYVAIDRDGDRRSWHVVFRGEPSPDDQERVRALLGGYSGEEFDPVAWGVRSLSGNEPFVVHELVSFGVTDEPPTEVRTWRQFVDYAEQNVTLDEEGELVYCAICGEPMIVEESGVAHHLAPPGGEEEYDFDRDADHVPIAETEYGDGTSGGRVVSGHFPVEAAYHPVQVVPVEQLLITKDAPELHEELLPGITDMLVHAWNLRVVPPVMVAEGVVNGRDVFQVLDGHHRLEAALRLGYEEIPVVNRLAMRRGDLSAHGRRVAAYRRLLGHPLAFETTGARKTSPLWNEGDNKAADAVIFRERAGRLEVLLGKRRRDNMWALLGGFMDKGETREQAARREAHEEAGINLQRKHLVGKTHVFGGKGTNYDPRDGDDRWVTTQAFVYAVPPQLEPRCVQDVDAGITDARFVPYELAVRRKLYAGHNEVLETSFDVLREALQAEA